MEHNEIKYIIITIITITILSITITTKTERIRIIVKMCLGELATNYSLLNVKVDLFLYYDSFQFDIFCN